MPSLPNPHAPQQSTRALIDPTRFPLIEAAYHEAGHAAVALALGIPFVYVSIVPHVDGPGHIHLRLPRDPRDQLTIAMAGLAGVVVALGGPAVWRKDAGGPFFGSIAGLSDAALASLVELDPPGDVTGSEHAAWRTAARDRAILDAGARASDLLYEPATERGLQSLAAELLRWQWLPYATARAAFAGETGSLSQHHNWTEIGCAVSLIS